MPLAAPHRLTVETLDPAVGPLLRYWREARRLSQLDLAHEAGVSPRHVSFLETGRAKPSREMVLALADTLRVPFRERNALLLAAGFAPAFRESRLDDPEVASVRRAIDAILAQQEPYPAVVMNRRWDILWTNGAAERFFARVLGGRSPARPDNVLHLMFDPAGARPAVENWEAVARGLVLRVHREAVGGVLDAEGEALLHDVLSYPGVPADLAVPDRSAPHLAVLPIVFRVGEWRFDYFSAVTVLGTPQDVALQELRIECFFPNDAATVAAAHAVRDHSS
jgi:transcriptional regulator with XRE-family HTH domain